jgi:hypothetical protein
MIYYVADDSGVGKKNGGENIFGGTTPCTAIDLLSYNRR